jgi:hypothetical protein
MVVFVKDLRELKNILPSLPASSKPSASTASRNLLIAEG